MRKSYSPSGDSGVSEKVESQLLDEVQLETLYKALKVSKGLRSDDTLNVFFKLFDVWIGLYRYDDVV